MYAITLYLMNITAHLSRSPTVVNDNGTNSTRKVIAIDRAYYGRRSMLCGIGEKGFIAKYNARDNQSMKTAHQIIIRPRVAAARYRFL